MVEPLGNIPGPYGKPIAVFASPNHPGEFFHDTDGCMDMAGIHNSKDRARCRAELGTGNGQSMKLDVLWRNGGRKVPKVALPKPAKSAYLDIPREPKIDEVKESWVSLVLDHADWASRAEALLDVIEGSAKEARSWTIAGSDSFEFVHAFSMSILLTSALEHLTEPEIDCLEAAAFYALAAHDEWSEAGIEWLHPYRRTWFRDWVADRPVYREFAGIMRSVNSDLPTWIRKGVAR
ncbi:hypothetical protein VSX64_19775 [Aurantimonas sp. C2-6-R+9]|uniref:hypothetical protein n=1 Tax=unclassified Aurantimonas TaxID=2638230 RepID=UPI002E177E73|nr:hypothetical protein [Aurantimonas sp. C2-6-R+9]